MRDLGSFGREPAPLDQEPLLQAILAFVRARTWSESRRVVEERPELLSDAADALLGLLIAAQEDADVRRYLEEHRALLRRCREVGVERAFREKMEALARSLSAAPSEEEIRHHPLYQLAEMVLRGELTLEAARQRAIAPDTLRALDDRSIDRMDDYIIALSRDPARPIGTRIRAYVLAELNHAAAQALPASPPIRADTANTLGNCIDDYPYKTPAHLERRVEAYREALAIWQQEGDPRRVAMTQNNLGNAYRELAGVRDREGNLERAIAAYREALGMIDRFFVTASVAAQLGLQEAWSGLYARAVEACHRAGQPALAFAIAEGSKSRLLTGLLGRSDLPAPAILPAELVEQERALTGRLNALDAAALARHGQTATTEEETPRLKLLEERQALLEQLQALWRKMETLDPRASDYVALRRGDRPSWEDLSRLAESLGPQTALLSLFTTGERILLFVLRAGWERPQAVEASLPLDELRHVYLANYEDEILHRSSHRQAGRPLTHRWRGLGRPLLSPALPYLGGITHLVIAPAGWFHLLPLHALDLDGSGETLLDRCAVSYVPALGLLERLRRREPAVAGEGRRAGLHPRRPHNPARAGGTAALPGRGSGGGPADGGEAAPGPGGHGPAAAGGPGRPDPPPGPPFLPRPLRSRRPPPFRRPPGRRPLHRPAVDGTPFPRRPGHPERLRDGADRLPGRGRAGRVEPGAPLRRGLLAAGQSMVGGRLNHRFPDGGLLSPAVGRERQQEDGHGHRAAGSDPGAAQRGTPAACGGPGSFGSLLLGSLHPGGRLEVMEMSEEIWLEEVLVPPEGLVEEMAKGLASLDERHLAAEKSLDLAALRQAKDKAAAIGRYIEERARGILRVHHPRHRPLTPEEAAHLPMAQGNLYLVRLGMELDVLPPEREAGWAYTVAWCRAYLFSPETGVQPRVLDLYPQRLYEGGPTAVRVEAGLGLKAGPVEAQIAQLGADLHVGQVTPVTLGFFGEEERAPYWELRARETPILGVYHFWMIVEQPPGCGPVRLAMMGEGNLQTRLFNIPVGPKERAWAHRPSIPLAG